MEIEPEIEKRIKRINSSLLEIIKNTKHEFVKEGERVVLVDVKNVGAFFEPRLKLSYDIHYNNNKRRYTETLVLSKDYKEIICKANRSLRRPSEKF